MIPNNRFFLTNVFFIAIAILVSGFIISFFLNEFFVIFQYALATFISIVFLDFFLILSSRKGISAQRLLNDKFSNNDENFVNIEAKNHFFFPVFIHILEELPSQLNERTYILYSILRKNQSKKITYKVIPKERGEYNWGNLNVFVKSPFYLISRRIVIENQQKVKVYPSYLNLRKYDLHTMKTLREFGLKKMRSIGHSMEFEQIKNYVQGDDVRTLNWKATAKRNSLMTNQFTDERSQLIYTILDTGRMMKMPFNGLSLLDYSINSSLIISKIVLNNQDKAGMFTFNKSIQNRVLADKKSLQMQRILDNLYAVQPEFLESDYSRLYALLKTKVTNRSLLFLYTNFETLDSLHRQLRYLRNINKTHLLVIIIFNNSELEQILINQKGYKNEDELMLKTLIEKSLYEKQLIVKELQMHGIQTIFTNPEELNINVINKYLEIKAKNVL